jgi:FMN phosphatase YigB (HAD superfamily)
MFKYFLAELFSKVFASMVIKAVLFDLHGTLAYMKQSVSDWAVSDFLVKKDYEVYPQTFNTAWRVVAFIDYPKYGYRNYRQFLQRVLWRLKVKVDTTTLDGLVRLYEQGMWELYPDARKALAKAKEHQFKTAIVTTIARFKFEKALSPIIKYIDVVMDGYKAGCEKTNPKMYKKTLEALTVAPSEAVMIGDDLEIDVILPKKLGIHAILLDKEGKIQYNASADAVVRDLIEAVETVVKRF